MPEESPAFEGLDELRAELNRLEAKPKYRNFDRAFNPPAIKLPGQKFNNSHIVEQLKRDLAEAERAWRAEQMRQTWETPQTPKLSAYQRFLAGPQWAEHSRKVLERAGGLCERCGKKAYCSHHKTYKHGWLPPLRYLEAVCFECHSEIHNKS